MINRLLPALLLLCLLLPAPAAEARSEIALRLAEVLDRGEVHGDLARAKLEIDRLIDPSVSPDYWLEEIDRMAQLVEKMAGPGATAWETMQALRDFLYQPGWWNRDHPFVYDHADPYGAEITNKLLHDYLTDRKGNCVSMPTLVLALGERLGLEMTAASAPLHIFVKFTDDAGKTWNIEPTSGAGAVRDVWYRQEIPMTDQAVEKGVYLRGLSRRETLALMAGVVLDHLEEEGLYHEMIQVAEILIERHPLFVYAMVKKGTAYYHLLDEMFYRPYPRFEEVPEGLRHLLSHLLTQNHRAFEEAEALGWQPPQR